MKPYEIRRWFSSVGTALAVNVNTLLTHTYILTVVTYTHLLEPSSLASVHAGFFSMTERGSVHETMRKWVMCPICRQHTDVGNIAYADDRQNGYSSGQDHRENEASLAVQGSYGTKVSSLCAF